MRDRVRIERRVTSSDGGGGQTGTWQALTTERCWIERLESFRFDVEREKAGSVDSMPLVRIHVYRNSLTDQITSGMRAVDLKTSKTMNINFIQALEGERGRRYVISASEGAAS
ncbi:MAG: head-tail adaptor protein [Pseudomonadales bacterium]|nr:head-tail adaptor protein [Pseudomonadales bacterium]